MIFKDSSIFAVASFSEGIQYRFKIGERVYYFLESEKIGTITRRVCYDFDIEYLVDFGGDDKRWIEESSLGRAK